MVETLVRDEDQLLNLLEEVKSLKGVNDIGWREIVETTGSIPRQKLAIFSQVRNNQYCTAIFEV